MAPSNGAGRTGAERYFAGRLEDPAYRKAYDGARERIQQVDLVVGAFDDRRRELDLSKADLARRAGVKPEAIRRLFSADRPNPTLNTLLSLASALDLDLRPVPRELRATSAPPSAAQSGTFRTGTGTP